MRDLMDMLWVEWRKALRSRMPYWTALASLFMPMGIAFLIFVSRNPGISRKLGLISAKADLLSFAGANWTLYLGMFGQLMAAGGFILFVFAISWTFGREFVDGTLKDMLAVPVPRASILAAKFIVVAIWSLALSVLMVLFGIVMGWIIGLPGGTPDVLSHGILIALATGALTVIAILPFALFASIGRGYLLPVGVAVLALMLANLVAIIGWADYYPWAVAGLFAQGKEALLPVSYAILLITCLAGMAATYAWWKWADQAR